MVSSKYKNPPVNELVFNVGFTKPIEGFSSQHVGLFWQTIKNDFPISSQAFPIGYAQELPNEVFPTPRYWFINENDDQLIQIQNNRFLCNWRKGENAEKYPSYSSLAENFRQSFSFYIDFIKNEGFPLPHIHECELTYINHFLQEQEWESLSDIRTLLPEFPIPTSHEAEETPVGLNLQYGFNLPDSLGLLTLKLMTATQDAYDKQLVVFELSAKVKRAFDNTNEVFTWFDKAHPLVVNSFETLVEDNVKRDIWKKQAD